MTQSPQHETPVLTTDWPARQSKVLSVCHIVSGDLWAGAEVQAAGLIRGLSRRPDVRVSAIVLNEGRFARELIATGIEVCVIPESSYGFRQILQRAELFLKTQRFDILHSHRYKENLLSVMAARRCHVPIMIRTQHGWPEPVRGWKAVKHAAVLAIDRFCGRTLADAVLCVSREMLPALQRIYGARTVLVRNAIDTSHVFSDLSREEAKRNLRLPVDAPVVGTFGRLERVKRVDLFLETAQILARRFPSAHFIVAGSGSMQEVLKQQAITLTLDGRVHFLGHRDDAYDVLRALDVLVMCSDSEGLPMALLEALWLGVPAVGRSVGGIKELLALHGCGLAVDGASKEALARAVERLLSDPALCERLRRVASQQIQEEFSLDRSVNQVANEYWRLAKQKSGTARWI